MDNHYHLLLETPEANLSRAMRQLNGVYSQASCAGGGQRRLSARRLPLHRASALYWSPTRTA
ncbi:MAG TPA: hypothetical protein VNQ15_12460, partial [Verrucomicrobiae bacterium]|nr:hypothetical protein [Verrucomicrobiae bacterium]